MLVRIGFETLLIIKTVHLIIFMSLDLKFSNFSNLAT